MSGIAALRGLSKNGTSPKLQSVRLEWLNLFENASIEVNSTMRRTALRGTRRIALFILCVSFAGFGADADLILHNGKVVTVDGRFSIQEAVALKSGRIIAVGNSRSVLTGERGSRTRLIDVSGRTVLLGLIDSHVHPVGAGLSDLRSALPVFDS
jgi:hypothetical protein